MIFSDIASELNYGFATLEAKSIANTNNTIDIIGSNDFLRLY